MAETNTVVESNTKNQGFSRDCNSFGQSRLQTETAGQTVGKQSETVGKQSETVGKQSEHSRKCVEHLGPRTSGNHSQKMMNNPNDTVK